MIKIGNENEEDPYFEQIPDEDLYFYQKKGAKRKRKLPDFIGKKDLKVLNSVKRKAYRLDLQLSLCGVRLGWAGIIGLLPWIGDLICLLLALQVVSKAGQIEGGLPVQLRLKMMMNVTFDFIIGLIPLVGDFINIIYKCNLRNFVLLEKYLVEKYSEQTPHLPNKPVNNSKHMMRPIPDRPNLADNTASLEITQSGIYNKHDLV